MDKYGINTALIRSQEFCWGGSAIVSLVALYLSMGLAFPILMLGTVRFVPFLRRMIGAKLDSDEVGQILAVVKGTSFFYVVISYADLANYTCEIPPGPLQPYLNAGPTDSCAHLACWRTNDIIERNNFTGINAEVYCQLCNICGQTGGAAKIYFIALLFAEAFFGFIIFTLGNDLTTLIGRLLIASICWINGIMWMAGVEFFRCREFSILPNIINNRCQIADVTVPGRVMAILYSFLGFLMIFVFLMGSEKDCDICGRKYWTFMTEYHHENMHVSRGLDENVRRFPKINTGAKNPS